MKYLLLIILIFAVSFIPEKKYAMTFTPDEIILIARVVDESNAPHQKVKQVQEILAREIRQHIDSTGKWK